MRYPYRVVVYYRAPQKERRVVEAFSYEEAETTLHELSRNKYYRSGCIQCHVFGVGYCVCATD